jgi:hypothetical protein
MMGLIHDDDDVMDVTGLQYLVYCIIIDPVDGRTA